MDNDSIRVAIGLRLGANLCVLHWCEHCGDEVDHWPRRGPDGMLMIPWTSGKLLVWDATCLDTYAPSHIRVAVTGAGAVAEKSAQYKMAKCSHLDSSYKFIPVAVETSGVLAHNPLSSLRT